MFKKPYIAGQGNSVLRRLDALYRLSAARQPSWNTGEDNHLPWRVLDDFTQRRNQRPPPKQLARDGADEYGVKEQFTWMPARGTLEPGTVESQWSPIPRSDSSISRPTPLISASSSTTVLRHTAEIHTSKYTAGYRPESALAENLLEDWDGIRLGGTLQCQTLSFRDLESAAFIDSRELGFRKAERFYKLNLQSRAKSMRRAPLINIELFKYFKLESGFVSNSLSVRDANYNKTNVVNKNISWNTGN